MDGLSVVVPDHRSRTSDRPRGCWTEGQMRRLDKKQGAGVQMEENSAKSDLLENEISQKLCCANECVRSKLSVM